MLILSLLYQTKKSNFSYFYRFRYKTQLRYLQPENAQKSKYKSSCLRYHRSYGMLVFFSFQLYVGKLWRNDFRRKNLIPYEANWSKVHTYESLPFLLQAIRVENNKSNSVRSTVALSTGLHASDCTGNCTGTPNSS